MNKRLFTALGLLALVATPVFAAQLWGNWPIVGSASYCSWQYTGYTGQLCGGTIAAGPASPTGLETIPAQTNITNSSPPQNVLLTMANLNALPVVVTTGSNTAVNAFSATSNQGGIILIGASSTNPFSATDITLPPSAVDGQQFRISAVQNIATLHISGSTGDTVSNAPTALTVSTTGAYGYSFRYDTSAKKWYRLQ